MKKNIVFIILFLALFCEHNFVQAQGLRVLPEGAIPFVYWNNHLYMQVNVNDSIPGNFIFDTGAAGLTFESGWVANAPLTNLNYVESRVMGVGTGGVQTIPAISDTLRVTFGNHTIETNNIRIRNSRVGFGDLYDGMIGKTYFYNNNYLVEINYVDEYMIIHNDVSTINLSNYTKIPLAEKQIIPPNIRYYIPLTIQVNDKLRIEDLFGLDVGSGGNLFIATPLAERVDLANHIPYGIRAVANAAGVSGQSTSVSFKADYLEIGGYRLDNLELRYSEDKSGSMASPHVIGGLLGNRILDHFDLVIDFGNEPALYLRPNRNFNTPFVDVSLLRGFGYADRSQTLKGWVVRGFFDGSPASKSGMDSGDKIISVNGVCIQDIPREKQQDFWLNLDYVRVVILRNDKEMMFEFEMNTAYKL